MQVSSPWLPLACQPPQPGGGTGDRDDSMKAWLQKLMSRVCRVHCSLQCSLPDRVCKRAYWSFGSSFELACQTLDRLQVPLALQVVASWIASRPKWADVQAQNSGML